MTSMFCFQYVIPLQNAFGFTEIAFSLGKLAFQSWSFLYAQATHSLPFLLQRHGHHASSSALIFFQVISLPACACKALKIFILSLQSATCLPLCESSPFASNLFLLASHRKFDTVLGRQAARHGPVCKIGFDAVIP